MTKERDAQKEFLNDLDCVLSRYFGSRSSDPDLEAFQRQFPAIPVLPLSPNPITVTSVAGNYTQEVEIPSGAQVMVIAATDSVIVSRSQITFPPQPGASIEVINGDRYIWCRNISTLTIGLINPGTIASIAFYSQLASNKLPEAKL